MSVGVVGWKILSTGAQGAMAAGAVGFPKGMAFFALHDAFQADFMGTEAIGGFQSGPLEGAAS